MGLKKYETKQNRDLIAAILEFNLIRFSFMLLNEIAKLQYEKVMIKTVAGLLYGGLQLPVSQLLLATRNSIKYIKQGKYYWDEKTVRGMQDLGIHIILKTRANRFT